MGRKALPVTAEITPDQPRAPDLMNNLNALAEHQQAIMDKYGEGLPYQRERIVHFALLYGAKCRSHAGGGQAAHHHQGE